MISDRAIDRLRDAAAWPELDARYEITGVAGHGGMGTVYVARDHVLDRDVAVKVLDIADQKGSRAARLQREAHILARLDHPGIVPVHDAGTLADGRAFYVMKLVKGRRLDDLIRDRLPLANRLTVFGRILDAVAFAHAHGIVHRDLEARERDGRRVRRGLRDGLGRRAGRRRRRRSGRRRHAGIHGARTGGARATSIRAPTSSRSASCSRSSAATMRRRRCARSRRRRGMRMPAAAIRRSKTWRPISRGFATRIPSRRIGSRWPSASFACIGGTSCRFCCLLAYVVMRFVLLMWRGI